MVWYSFQEQAEMVFMYGQAGGNGQEAAWKYRATYPDRQYHPHHTTFGAIYRHSCEHGSFETDEHAGWPQTVRTSDVEEHVLHDIENNSATSSRQVACQHGVSQRTVICILHDNRYYPYHLQCVQGLSPADFPPQKRFCCRLVQQAVTIMGFLSSVLFTDEATFGHDGIITLHNSHLQATDNPQGMVEASYQQWFSINVWAGIIADHLLGPVLLPQCLNGEMYLSCKTRCLHC